MYIYISSVYSQIIYIYFAGQGQHQELVCGTSCFNLSRLEETTLPLSQERYDRPANSIINFLAYLKMAYLIPFQLFINSLPYWSHHFWAKFNVFTGPFLAQNPHQTAQTKPAFSCNQAWTRTMEPGTRGKHALMKRYMAARRFLDFKTDNLMFLIFQSLMVRYLLEDRTSDHPKMVDLRVKIWSMDVHSHKNSLQAINEGITHSLSFCFLKARRVEVPSENRSRYPGSPQ